MIQFEHTIDIDRSPAEVFEFLVDIDRMPDWQQGVVAIAMTTVGPVRLGTEFDLTMKKGRHFTANGKVVAYQPNTLVAFSGDAPPANTYCAFELTPTDGGRTRVVARYEFELHGLWRLLRPMVAAGAPRETGGELRVMKRLLEHGTVTARPSLAQ